MSVASAIKGVKEEAGSIVRIIREELDDLDFSTTSAVTIRDKYNLISREVLGLSYDQLIDARALPPINPNVLYDQVRLGLIDVTALGDIFFPSTPTGDNLKTLQAFYQSVGENLTLVAQELTSHPPGVPATETFDIAVNRYTVTTIPFHNSDGRPKTEDEIATELGHENFELFVFASIPQLYYLVTPTYLNLNTKLEETVQKFSVPKEQLSCQVTWLGSLNANAANASKMKVSLGLTNAQIRAASFGDDLAISNSSAFLLLLKNMQFRFNFLGSSLPTTTKILSVLDAVQQYALVFLAQLTFGTTVVSDRDAVTEARAAGVSDTDLEASLVNRSDPNFVGANLSANELVSTVFPATSNAAERKALDYALQQTPDTLRFTNSALNQTTDYRAESVTAAKRLVASLTAHSTTIAREAATSATITQDLLAVLGDISALETAYANVLSPPVTTVSRKRGSRTVESANNILSRACNLVRSLRIPDQISDFPKGYDGTVGADLQLVLGGLTSLSNSIETYLSIYRNGEIRDFLATVISVASVTNLLLADGEPGSSLIVTEYPVGIEQLRAAIEDVLLDDTNTEVLYNDVSLQVGAFASVLRGNKDDDPVGRLLDLPVAVLDALLPSEVSSADPTLTLERDQEAALQQIRDSFDALRSTVVATVRDLGIYGSNFGSALNDAEFFVARLAGDSVKNLVTELRQS